MKKSSLEKKARELVVFAILFAIVVIGGLAYMFFSNRTPDEYFIFQDINECEQLIPADKDNANIEQYDTPAKDKDLKGLSYDNFWGMKFQSDAMEYEIFAYEFKDADSALKYYVNVTGQHNYEKKLPLNSEDENKNLSASKGMFSYEIVITYQNNAYRLTAPSKYEDEVTELLANTFSLKIA